MGWVVDILLAAGGLFTAMVVAFVFVVTRVRRLPVVRRLPLIGMEPSPRVPVIVSRSEEGGDLLSYPRRLEEMEGRLEDRHRAVQAQLRVLAARRAEVAAKGGREDLAKKYDADVAMLDRRAESMRRVMALVWKTRAVLLMRVHLATTARRRPELGRLPSPGAPGVNLADATATYHAAAAAVRFYVDAIEARIREFATSTPEPPVIADVDESLRATVMREHETVAVAYADLRERMDHLADNLTFLGDHFGALAVVDSEPEDLRRDGDPAHLLEEVSAALAGLKELAGRVDPTVVDNAVTNLAEEITHLEEAGLEAEAEAEAHLEVERLLGQFPA
jgi:hypothetical protein